MASWPTISELKRDCFKWVDEAFLDAKREGLTAKEIELSHMLKEARATHISDVEEYQGVTFDSPCKKAYMVCLFIDMIGSTRRNDEKPLWKSFLANRGYLNLITKIAVCGRAEGVLAGYRGDGAFFVWPYKNDPQDDGLSKREAVQNAVAASMRSFEALDRALKPVLAKYDVDEVLARGGLDYGCVLVTRVGLDRATSELSILGSAADNAANKASGGVRHGELKMEGSLNQYIPEAEDGKDAAMGVRSDGSGAYILSRQKNLLTQ